MKFFPLDYIWFIHSGILTKQTWKNNGRIQYTRWILILNGR
jgi:hypothetical protein